MIEGVWRYDAPDGQQVEMLTRALVNSQKEVDAGGWVEARDPGKVTWVRLSELRFVPPPNAGVYFDRFVAVYRERNPPYYQNATCSFEAAAPGETRATLRMQNDRRTTEYSYLISASGVRPLSMTLFDSIAGALEWFGSIVIATAVATAATVSLFIGVVVYGLATRT